MPLEQQVLMNDRQPRHVSRTWKRDELVDEFLANNHAVEAIITMEEQFEQPASAARRRTAWW